MILPPQNAREHECLRLTFGKKGHKAKALNFEGLKAEVGWPSISKNIGTIKGERATEAGNPVAPQDHATLSFLFLICLITFAAWAWGPV